MTTSTKSGKEQFFDEHGRCIPDGVTSPVYKETRRYFQIPKMKVNYLDNYNRIKSHLGSDGGITPEDFKKNREADIPLKRIGKPEDVAKAVVFLASEESSYTIGEAFNVSGGLVMH